MFPALAAAVPQVFGLPVAIGFASAEAGFRSGGFARVPEAAHDIANVPAPLFRDTVFDGAADETGPNP